MGILFRNYVKRYRMHRALSVDLPPAPILPGFELVPWELSHIAGHADVMAHSFRDSFDARLFPNLARNDGCLDLMQIIAGHQEFLPEATWLLRHLGQYVAGIQALGTPGGLAMIQNLAVRPTFQGRGLGKMVLRASLLGMRAIGITEVRLEVSAKNERAVRLYHGFDFHQAKTLYRETQTDSWDYTI